MSALAIEAAEPLTVKIADLTRDPELACRAAGINAATVSDYQVAMLAATTFPPIVVFRDAKGVQWLADGFHRCAAAEAGGIVVLPADVREGARKDALLFAASANASHGLRRTNADKRRAVQLVLGNFPKWSDRKIAEAVGVDHKTVGAARNALSEAAEPDKTEGDPGSAPVDADQLVARLTKALDRVLEQWPSDRREELHSRLLEVCTQPA